MRFIFGALCSLTLLLTLACIEGKSNHQPKNIDHPGQPPAMYEPMQAWRSIKSE